MEKDFVEIPLTQGKVALVDAEDAERVNEYRWCANKVILKSGKVKFYASRTVRKGVQRQLHRFLTNAKRGQEVDHKNGDGLDNRKSNLRVCTRAQNLWNRGKTKPGSSIYKGVVKTKHNRWAAYIKANGKREFLGCYATEIEAAAAYDKRAKELHGEFAYLNLPESHSVTPKRLSYKAEPERNRQILNYYLDGYTLEKIGENFGGISRQRIQQIVSSLDAEPRRPKQKGETA